MQLKHTRIKSIGWLWLRLKKHTGEKTTSNLVKILCTFQLTDHAKSECLTQAGVTKSYANRQMALESIYSAINIYEVSIMS